MASPVKSPLNEALAAQAIRNERNLARGALATTLAGVLTSGLLALTAPEGSRLATVTGPRLALLCAAAVSWFAIALFALSRNRGVRLLPWLNTSVEALFPVAMMLVECYGESAAFAAYSSLAPLVYAAVFTLSTMRLRWQIPLFAGALGAVSYAALLAFVLLPRLSPGHLLPETPAETVLVIRPLVVLLLGGVAAMINRSLRVSVGEVHGRLRSQEIFGKYRLGEVIAAGGMGEVVKAVYCPEGGFEKQVAIKRINAWLANDLKFVEAFRREAELCSRLTHPNIVQVFDFGQEGGSYYLAMEYVEGVTLSQLLKSMNLKQEQVPASLVAEIGRRIGAALTFAQQEARGPEGNPLRVIHRDLSPSNVLLSRAGEVKVTDFGIAKALGSKEATHTQTVSGKLAYMAPEQAMAEPLDGRGDLFALGIVLWETLCGARLFSAETDAATLTRVLNASVPPPSRLRPELAGTGWDAFFVRALARPRGDRFQTAAELAAALSGLGGNGDNREVLARLVGDALAQPRDPLAPAAARAPAAATAPTVSMRGRGQ